MKRRIATVIAVILVFALVASCAGRLKPIRLVLHDQKDDGEKYILPIKSTLAVVLADEGRYGYRWTTTEIDGGMLRRAGRSDPSAHKEVAGGPGETVLLFESLSKGITTLELAYCVPARCGETIVRTFSVKLKIEKK